MLAYVRENFQEFCILQYPDCLFYYFLFKSSTLFCTHNHAFMHDLLSLYPNSLLVGTQMKLLLLKNQVAWRNGSFCFLLCQLLPNPQHCSLWPFTVNLLSWCTVERVAFSSPWKEIISNTKYFLFTGATQNFCGFFFFYAALNSEFVGNSTATNGD